MSSTDTSTRLTPQEGRFSNNKTTNMEDKHHPQHFPTDRRNYRNPKVHKKKKNILLMQEQKTDLRQMQKT